MNDAEKHLMSGKLYLPIFQSIFCYFYHGNIFQFYAKGSQVDFIYTTMWQIQQPIV